MSTARWQRLLGPMLTVIAAASLTGCCCTTIYSPQQDAGPESLTPKTAAAGRRGTAPRFFTHDGTVKARLAHVVVGDESVSGTVEGLSRDEAIPSFSLTGARSKIFHLRLAPGAASTWTEGGSVTIPRQNIVSVHRRGYVSVLDIAGTAATIGFIIYLFGGLGAAAGGGF